MICTTTGYIYTVGDNSIKYKVMACARRPLHPVRGDIQISILLLGNVTGAPSYGCKVQTRLSLFVCRAILANEHGMATQRSASFARGPINTVQSAITRSEVDGGGLQSSI